MRESAGVGGVDDQLTDAACHARQRTQATREPVVGRVLEGDALAIGGVAPATRSASTTRLSRMNVRSRNRVRISGRPGAPVVALAHGFGCDQNMWCLVVPAPERDFMVVVFDHVRSRRSDLPAWSKERYSSLEWAPARRRHCASGTIRAEQPIQLVSASQRPNAADDTDRRVGMRLSSDLRVVDRPRQSPLRRPTSRIFMHRRAWGERPDLPRSGSLTRHGRGWRCEANGWRRQRAVEHPPRVGEAQDMGRLRPGRAGR